MAAREDEPEPVVADVAHRLGWLGALVQQRGLRLTVMAGCLATQSVDSAVASGGGQPPTRVGRYAADRPPLARDGECLLGHVLGDVDVAEESDQGGDDPTNSSRKMRSRSGAPSAGTVGQASVSSWKGRTSTGPMQAAQPLAAHSSAASRSGAWMTQNPPSCSLVSANGPSVVWSRPLRANDGCDLRRVKTSGEDSGTRGLTAS